MGVRRPDATPLASMACADLVHQAGRNFSGHPTFADFAEKFLGGEAEYGVEPPV